MDDITKTWIRNESDERAAANGCRFDVERGEFVVSWIERYCRLYEGEDAGKPMTLRRAPDWQYDCIMRLFGWVRFSPEWNREIRRFRRGSVWVPKKNKKSPTLAAVGLYLAFGDGEPGQKVFTGAKDGKQAWTAHQHALEMVRQSPELMRECHINQNTGRITHARTRSRYGIIAADNMDGQEGLNGSILIDETHVVDSRLMSVLRGAGISRSEPMLLQFSTAGKNPDGYGKQQWDYGREVESGKFTDQEYFYAAFAAPEDLADSDLDAEPVKFGKMANPAWGHTIKEEEYLSHYNEARKTPQALADFKMYRLNIWQKTTNPWLKVGAWDACTMAFVESELEGRVCTAGLDLSKTQDMTALVLCFKLSEMDYRLLPFFWMPEARARELNHLAPFLDWAKRGLLELTPGEVVDYGFVRNRFRELAARFQIKELAYDKIYAEETTQAMSEGVLEGGRVVEQGTGVPRLEFPQTITNFANPVAEMERLVLERHIHHNGHAILAWQMGHVEMYSDCNGNKRPVKPKGKTVKKIDGVVAGLMALARALPIESGISVYESRGIESI